MGQTGVSAPPPIILMLQLVSDGLDVRLDDGWASGGADRGFNVFQAIAGHDDDDGVIRLRLAALRQAMQSGERRRSGRLGEDAEMTGKRAHGVQNILVADRHQPAAGISRGAQGFQGVAGLPDRNAVGNGLDLAERLHRLPGFERRNQWTRASGLHANHLRAFVN